MLEDIDLVEVTVKLVPFEPDGTKCGICEDVIFLEGVKPIVVMKNGKKIGETDHRFCQSCGDALKSEMEGGESCERECWR